MRARRVEAMKAGVFGASGTAGAELITLLADHPRLDVAFGTARQAAGRSLAEIEPAAPELTLEHPGEVDPGTVDIAFLCLPHGASAEVAARCLEAGTPVVDLSGDLRLHDRATHARVYGTPRLEALAERAVYGLTELNRRAVSGARLVANPGCYPTCAGLALAPLAEAGLIGALAAPVIIDAKSGVSGAGRKATDTTHFLSVEGDLRPYKIGRCHRHVAEIEQTLTVASGGEARRVLFTPQLVPIARGILETIVVPVPEGSANRIRETLHARYGDEPFVDVLPAGRAVRLASVVRTNRAALSVHEVEGLDAVVIVAAIDNLLKGAAGQAVQNANLMLGLPEALGLPGATRAAPEARYRRAS